MKGGSQGFPRHVVSDKQEVLFEDVSPSTALSIHQLDMGQEFSGYIKREEKEKWFAVYKVHCDFKLAVTRKSRPCRGTLRVLIKQIAA